MRTALLVVLAFILGTIVTYVAVVAGTLVAWEFLGIHDRDGGGSMGLAFIIGPFFGLIGGVAAAVFAFVRLSRGAPAEGRARTSRGLGAAAAGVGAFLFGYWLGSFVGWMAGPYAYDNLGAAIIAAWAPTLIGLGLGALAIRFVLRRPAPTAP
ncbi:hypothetical protein [Alsobacter sp. R-9]